MPHFSSVKNQTRHKLLQDRLFSIAASRSLPVVLFAEGGGGRPGDTDTNHLSASQLDVPTFATFARLRGRVPLVVLRLQHAGVLERAVLGDDCLCSVPCARVVRVTYALTRGQGVVSGRCFAGNAVLLACCDIVIATDNSNMGLGGPVRCPAPLSS